MNHHLQIKCPQLVAILNGNNLIKNTNFLAWVRELTHTIVIQLLDSRTGTIPTPCPIGQHGLTEAPFRGYTRGAVPVFFF